MFSTLHKLLLIAKILALGIIVVNAVDRNICDSPELML